MCRTVDVGGNGREAGITAVPAALLNDWEGLPMDKIDLLEYLTDHGSAGLTEVTTAFDVSGPAAGMALLRLLRQGLVARYLDPDRPLYWYALTPKGRARLNHLQQID